MWVDWLGRFQRDACCLYLSFYTENTSTVMEQMFPRTRFSDKGLIDIFCLSLLLSFLFSALGHVLLLLLYTALVDGATLIIASFFFSLFFFLSFFLF